MSKYGRKSDERGQERAAARSAGAEDGLLGGVASQLACRGPPCSSSGSALTGTHPAARLASSPIHNTTFSLGGIYCVTQAGNL